MDDQFGTHRLLVMIGLQATIRPELCQGRKRGNDGEHRQGGRLKIFSQTA